MIEVSAHLIGGPVYFAGDRISCRVTFSNVRQTAGSAQSSIATKKSEDVLGWASAQVVCVCTINPQKVLVVDSISNCNTSMTVNSTSLSPKAGERGLVIFSTKPKILVCDLTLPDDSNTDYLYQETLPSNLPPSFRGQAIKYSYKLKIGLQRVGAPVKLLNVPFRLMTWQLCGLPNCQDEQGIVVSNPFLKTSQCVNPEFDDPLETIQLLTSRRSPSVYKVTNGNGKVVNLCLFKSGYRLGEDIVGTLDFSASNVSCIQYSVSLQSQEVVPEEKRRRIGPHSKFADEIVTSYSKHHEFWISSNPSIASCTVTRYTVF
ncbi:RAB6A-GEF complex partner protein 2-like isoform X2 [Daphnia carinata]|uniref:RAB6A-GEF complex partner protein 2-like isoform X2 n=1 Tax=Daphnia carinata TaxID=120202 RepID=UPI00257FC96C|nr:RAB6A-GEF complex partner protein 2-like isoform X2 [Daphnia carinata]